MSIAEICADLIQRIQSRVARDSRGWTIWGIPIGPPAEIRVADITSETNGVSLSDAKLNVTVAVCSLLTQYSLAVCRDQDEWTAWGKPFLNSLLRSRNFLIPDATRHEIIAGIDRAIPVGAGLVGELEQDDMMDTIKITPTNALLAAIRDPLTVDSAVGEIDRVVNVGIRTCLYDARVRAVFAKLYSAVGEHGHRVAVIESKWLRNIPDDASPGKLAPDPSYVAFSGAALWTGGPRRVLHVAGTALAGGVIIYAAGTDPMFLDQCIFSSD
jgi:hypothetical protein